MINIKILRIIKGKSYECVIRIKEDLFFDSKILIINGRKQRKGNKLV
jgi:hypothetical protein